MREKGKKPYTLHVGNSIDVLKTIPDNSIDSIVTDPPYGLSKEPDMAEVIQHWLAGDDYQHKGSGFMGKTWDSFVPGPAVWRECLRVLKPGGHLLAFFGSRTYDMGTLAIRLAGFEVRDQIMWVYGSGFPKSLDVSKAIDATVLTGSSHSKNIRHAIQLRPGETRETATLPNNGVMSKDRKGGITNDNAATEAARQWQGWGTALKPAHEPICVARKPFNVSVASNVLEHGTGALNINDCRMPLNGGRKQATAGKRIVDSEGGWGVGKSDCSYQKGTGAIYSNVGRWPANLVHDGSEEVLAGFPQSSVTGKRSEKSKAATVAGTAWGTDNHQSSEYTDNGSAARFFYCAKTSRQDRDEGCEHLVSKEWRTDGAPVPQRDERPFIPSKNNHPTVKPTSLMEWLTKLVTPPGGTILDPFNGSGSTGKAAMLNDFNYIGIDLSQDYIDISEKRIEYALKNKDAILKGIRSKSTSNNKPDTPTQLGQNSIDPIDKFFEMEDTEKTCNSESKNK